MKKWLVGLMAASLCAASAWAETVKYTVTSKTAVEVTGTAPEGATAEYVATANNVCQITSNNTATLTLKGFNGTTITGLTLSMKSNSGKGKGSLSVTCGDTAIASIADANFNDATWNGAWSTEYVDVKPAVTATTIDDDVVILISGTVNSLYCQSYTIEYTVGDPVFSVKFDKENWFKVAQGQASSVTAIPQYGVEPYTFLWESDTLELNGGTTDTLQIPDTLSEGDYTVACLVTDDGGEGDAINALIGFTVEAIPVISGDDFALVSSSDELQDGARYLITDVTHSFAMSSEAVGSALSAVEVKETEGVITATDESTIWTLVEDTDGNFALQNGDKYVGWGSGNEAKMQAAAFANKISIADKVATITAGSDSTRNLKYNKTSPRFAYYTSAQTDLALFKEAGEAGLSVSFDKANGFTVDLGTADSITATAKNGTEPYSYVWTSDTADLNGTGDTLAIPATLAAGDYTVQVEVTDADSNKASKQIGFTVAAPAEKFTVTVADGFLNGTLDLKVNGEIVDSPAELAEGTQVTVVATPESGYRLDKILLNGEELTENPFTVTADALLSAEFSLKPVLPGVTYTVKATNSVEITSGEAPEGSIAEYASTYNKIYQLTASNSMTLTLKGYEGYKVTGLTLSMHSNGTKGSGSLSATCGEATIASIEDSAFNKGWSTAYTTNWVNVTPEVTATTIDGDIVITITASVNSLYCEAITVEYEAAGPVQPSIAFTGETEKTLPDAAFELAFTLKNYDGDYAWSLADGEGTLGEGGVYTWTATEAGEYPITVSAMNGEEVIATKEVTLKVNDPAAKYAITVERVPGGVLSVEGDKTEAEEGETVKVTATADEGMKLAAITVTGDTTDLSFTSSPAEFSMPAEAVTVSAVFEEFEIPPYYFQFETGASIAYATNAAAFVNTGSTATEEDPTVAFTVQRTTLGKDAGDKVVGTQALRMAPIGETNSYAFNSAAFAEPITGISFQYGIYGTSDKCDSFTVSTSSDGENWTLLVDLTKDASYELKTYENGELPENTYFVRFDASNTVKGNSRRINIDEIQLFTGAPAPKISFEGETSVIMSGGTAAFSLQFSLANYDGDYTWAVTSGKGSIDENGAYTWTATEPGEYSITVAAKSGDDDLATKTVTLKAMDMTPPPGPGDVTLTCEPASVTMAAGESKEVTATLTGVESFTGYIYIENFDLWSEEGESPWTFDLADLQLDVGSHELTLIAYDGDGELASAKLTVTVTDGPGPQPGVQPVITSISVAGSQVTLTFTGDGSAVQGADDLTAGNWADVNATIGSGTATVPQAKPYLRIRQ